MKHVLPIKSTYVSNWGIWECVRELIQNAKDEEDENDHKMTVTHKSGWLHIENEGADLQVNALLIGETSKAGNRKLRGEHGEGLDLAFLAGVRDEYDIRVETKTESWTPKLEYIKAFNSARCLVVTTRKLKNERTGVRVSVRIDRKNWLDLKKRFLFLDPPSEIMETDSGSLIMDEDRKGDIFVKGIYVMKAHKAFGFGFDLNNVRLDRDRQMIGAFDLQWALAHIIKDALGREPMKYAGTVMDLLDKGSDEVEYLGSALTKGSDASQALATAFKAEHGDNAIPVGSIAESQQLDHLGAKGVVVNAATVKALAPELGDYSEVAARLRMKPTNRYGWHDLTEVEQANLTKAELAISSITSEHMKVKAQLQVVDFADGSIEGSCNLGSGEIKVARSQCGNYFDLMEVMVHEVAHAVSQAQDGTISHVRTIEKMWRRLYEDASVDA